MEIEITCRGCKTDRPLSSFDTLLNGRSKLCASCRAGYSEKLRSLGAKRKAERDAHVESVKVEVAQGEPKDAVEVIVNQAKLVGALRHKAILLRGGLRGRQAWRAYFSQEQRLKELVERLRARLDRPPVI